MESERVDDEVADESVDDEVRERTEMIARVRRLQARAKAAELTTRTESGFLEDLWLYIEYPAGRSKRTIMYQPDEQRHLEGVEFEAYHFFSDVNGCINTQTGVIGARIGSLNNRGVAPRLWTLPGAEHLNADGEWGPVPPLTRSRRPDSWRVAVARGDITVELSPCTPEFFVMQGLRPEQADKFDSLKITGASTATNEEALKVLQSIGGATLFDIDLRYKQPVAILPMRGIRSMRPNRRDETPVHFPSNRYVAEPLALYNYGRSAAGLPLLEFLAYYQTVEYFFSTYANAETLHRVQNMLRDPQFDSRNDFAVARLILASQTARRGGPERENLRVALRSCVEVEELEQFVKTDERHTDHFCSKKQTIGGVKAIQLQNSQTDLRDQVADRLYAIRCRVVHTKEDGGDAQVDLLLPTSREARSLAPDVDLARLVAQRVLIANSTPL